MTKKFRRIKVSLIIGILLGSILISTIPVSTAKMASSGLFGFSHVVEIEWKGITNASLPIKPYEETRAYTLIVNYELTKGPLGTLLYKLLYAGQRVDIRLTISDYPDEWSTVTMPDSTISFGLPSEPTDKLDFERAVVISIDDDSPAFKEGPIVIHVEIPNVGMIQKFEEDITLTMNPDYAPLLDVQPETQHKKIGPMDTAEIALRVTNDGNGRTRAMFSVSNQPSGWLAIVTDQIILDPDETGYVYLTVKPPKGFGYHDDYESFVIDYVAAWAENTDIRSDPQHVSVAVESRGISVIGIEVILPFIILIILIIVVVFIFFKKYRRG